MLRIAKKLALKSEHRQHHHACIITKGGNIIATGYNHKFMHAEEDAIRKISKRFLCDGKKQKGLVLYSFRWTKGGQWGDAKPCSGCSFWINNGNHMYSISTTYYTNTEGVLTKL
jgi:pyrimidine deaminase RibD-like protein